MDAVVRPGGVGGAATPPPSKSETHRAMILAALAGGAGVTNPLESADTAATATLLDALGATVTWSTDAVAVEGFDGGRPTAADDPIDCANSGTTLRLGIALAALADGTSTLVGDGSLSGRPNAGLLRAVGSLGARAETDDGDTAPVTVTGPLRGGTCDLAGDVSSQYVTALLLAGTRMPAGLDLGVRGPLVSRSYVALTLELLGRFGVAVDESDDRYRVPPDAEPVAPADDVGIEPDPTAASYLLAAGAIAGDPAVTVTGIGDRGATGAPIVDLLGSMAVPVEGGRTVGRATPSGTTVDLGDSPDLLPTAAVLGGAGDGTTTIVGCAHARRKETDRVATTAAMLADLGVSVAERPDGLVVEGRAGPFLAGTVESHGDHRIAMAGAVAALAADGPVRIEHADAVDVSYPRFFEALSSLGADVAYPAP